MFLGIGSGGNDRKPVSQKRAGFCVMEKEEIMKQFILIVAIWLVLTSIGFAADCESRHWIKSASSDGRIVILEDGSVWEVDPVDRIDSMLWLPTSDVIACEDKLTNTDDNESVDARRIR